MLQLDKEDCIDNTKYFSEGDGECLFKRREGGGIKGKKDVTQKMNTIFGFKKIQFFGMNTENESPCTTGLITRWRGARRLKKVEKPLVE